MLWEALRMLSPSHLELCLQATRMLLHHMAEQPNDIETMEATQNFLRNFLSE